MSRESQVLVILCIYFTSYNASHHPRANDNIYRKPSNQVKYFKIESIALDFVLKQG